MKSTHLPEIVHPAPLIKPKFAGSVKRAKPHEKVRCGRTAARLFALLLSMAACTGLTGCSFLKPAKSTVRHFVLTPLPATKPAEPGSMAIGVGKVKIPAYLFDTSLALRKGTNEIEYLPSALWAERLDAGFQRVLAADLAVLLPTDSIRLSAWQKDDVAMEVYVTIMQFDVDTSGHGILVAQWRLLSPGGEKILKTGTSRLTRGGPAPDADPQAAVATLSELVADLSRQIAQALPEASADLKNAESKPK